MKNPLQNLFAAVSQALTPSPLQVDIPLEWLSPISDEQPSGASLEYDPEYAVLAARLVPKAEVQYGQFKSSGNEPEWKEIERDCRRLLLRSKDIGVLIWFARSRTRQAGAQGLLGGLSALQQVCEHFAASVHPQLQIEGEHDPMVRANALAALCDPEGLLEDVREVVIVAASAHRLTVRDVERALAVPRPAYAMDPEALQRQLTDLYQRLDVQLQSLQACAACVQYLQDWAHEQLGDEAPSLLPLLKLLQPLLGSTIAVLPVPTHKLQAQAVETPTHTRMAGPAPEQPSQAGQQQDERDIERAVQRSATPTLIDTTPAWPEPAPMAPALAASPVQNREQVRQALAQVRGWIEENEPSSPVAVLLKQAERMWGKRFSEVAHMIPPELLQAWDQA